MDNLSCHSNLSRVQDAIAPHGLKENMSAAPQESQPRLTRIQSSASPDALQSRSNAVRASYLQTRQIAYWESLDEVEWGTPDWTAVLSLGKTGGAPSGDG
ncbi:hypothetical protein BHE90_011271 [Fusarium euwallaceae]|uniref:Uncharacterized protein n=4 Tax=Fusarium solani species complex TaxID=232080 RepID=A0A3M2RZH2_9HYPO|nr:hypothetical protein CDV36_009655 [Fusarium kuroshium]RSL73004.1 hypothetical protein CEP51_011811 [Fusarium floridanum]RSM08086.1 hypothetical protein CDV31_008299 [Fusarium ambrosium]RTE74277.1 hypothetical protein BHE90_011271 [Fusarium euwallaceae]